MGHEMCCASVRAARLPEVETRREPLLATFDMLVQALHDS